MNQRQIKQQFRPYLPKGFVRIIQMRLQDQGVKFSKTYISYVCNPDSEFYEDRIITAALDLAAETKRNQAKLIEKVKAL